MRININTNGKPVKDPDVRALYLLNKAMELSTNKMAKANIDFITAKWRKKLNHVK